MNRLIALTRCNVSKATLVRTGAVPLQQVHFSGKSSADDDTPSDQKPPESNKETNQALNKLNELLKKMVQEDVVNANTKLELAKPRDKRRKTKEEKDDKQSVKVETAEEKVVSAIKHVAETLGGNVKQTESELLMKLLDPVEKSAGSTVSSLSDIVKGMKIERETKPQGPTRAEQVQEILKKVRTKSDDFGIVKTSKQPRRPVQTREKEIYKEKIDLFGSKPLGIFTSDSTETTEGVENKTWNKLYERELKLAVTHPPANYFQQMILWTEQGKVWKFPIDNEQGLEKEQNVYFAEHVFLEKHLEPWCPPKGPIRHFMELVCVGLSKNPYLTVEAKKEHIDWFKNYFEEKKQLLKEVGALQGHKPEVKQLDE